MKNSTFAFLMLGLMVAVAAVAYFAQPIAIIVNGDGGFLPRADIIRMNDN